MLELSTTDSVTEDVTLVLNQYAKIMESGAEIDDLINASMSGFELQAIGSSFDGSLFLGVPVNAGLVE